MVKSSRRELLATEQGWSIPQVMAALAGAIEGTGPALGFGTIASSEVPEEIALVVGTSGSTGVAKEVALTKFALLHSATMSNKYLGAEIGDSWALSLPLTHIAAVNVLLRSHLLKSQPLDARTSHQPADFTAIVPTQLFRAINGDNELLETLIGMKSILVGGAALSDDLYQRASDRGVKIVRTYGMSETSGGCIYEGAALPGVTFTLEGNGEISIGGQTLASGYLRAGQLDSTNFKDGIFHTRDFGKLENGKLQVLGRVDDIITTGGENLSLDLVESVLKDFLKSEECAAFTVADPEWGAALCIATITEVNKEVISNLLEESIGVHAKPKHFTVIDRIPRTSIGKVDRRQLGVNK